MRDHLNVAGFFPYCVTCFYQINKDLHLNLNSFLLLNTSLHTFSRNSKLELELAQVRADFEHLKSQDSTKSERLEELS